MVFTSLDFAAFFSLIFFVYWFVLKNNTKGQNILILVSSYIFYGWWDWRFLLLIFVSSLTDYLIGIAMEGTIDKLRRRILLYISLGVNLGILFFFKYFNFFIDSLKMALGLFNSPTHFDTLDIILPIGISFYTLQTLSYTIDIYDGKLKASRSFVNFFAYVSFFPQLVAGPIERASNLLPQFSKPREFTYDRAVDGCRQVLWGLFKKLVIADNCALYVDMAFSDYGMHNGSTLFLATIFGSFQYYCDFSGYSDIAIGIARILGFDLMKNFDYPFFSRNISEFWQKWHISLMQWFRLYIVSRLKGFSKNKVLRNIFVVFLITGIWHGANWTFIVWGLLNAIAFIPLIYGKRKKYRKPIAHGKLLPDMEELIAVGKTFMLFCLIGIFFRSANLTVGVEYTAKLFRFWEYTLPVAPNAKTLFGILILVSVEWLQRKKEFGLEFKLNEIPKVYRWAIYFALIGVISVFGGNTDAFIYFQF